MSRVRLSADGCLGWSQCFAGPNAFVPRVIRLDVTNTSAVSEPRTAAAAATMFPRLRDDAALGANGTDGRRRGWCCVNVVIGQNTNMTTPKQSVIGMRDGISYIYID